MQLGQLTILLGLGIELLGIVLLVGGTAISMLIDIHKKLELIPKAGYVFTCAIAYTLGLTSIIVGIIIIALSSKS